MFEQFAAEATSDTDSRRPQKVSRPMMESPVQLHCPPAAAFRTAAALERCRCCCSFCGGHLQHGREAGPLPAYGQPLSADERVPDQQHEVQEPRADHAHAGDLSMPLHVSTLL